MPKCFRIKHKTDPSKLHVRDLRPGMVVPVGEGKTATVHSIEWMNGRNGEPPTFVSRHNGIQDKSALAMKVYFHDHEPLISAYRFPDHWIDHEQKSGSLFERLHQAYVSRAIEIIQASSARTVLEVGCGDGWNCGEMVKVGLDVVGIDWSPNAIAYASMFVPGAKFYQGDVRDAAFLRQFPDKFDALALIEVLEHIPPKDCISAMANIAEPLKSGGTFVLTTPSVNFPNDTPLHYQHFTEEKLRHIAKESGLVVKSIEGYGDVFAARVYWRRMRWVENSLYSIKPAAKFLTEKYHRETNLRSTPLDRCHGFIMTMTKL
jgi:2-polyprenyl-3-methyl-5-hydroxy-6-metoxy-1,4-benzoquinol methylase